MNWQDILKTKRFKKVITNKKTGRKKTVKYGQSGKAKDGGDRIRPNTSKGDAYCARSNKIKGDWRKDPNSPNNLSRKKWKCHGNKSSKSYYELGKHFKISPRTTKAFWWSKVKRCPIRK